ncbi:hypothetical protein TWF481_003110 [Arthrobotrys musiformis]|uniref:BTB domain-containing protein n=1 Tax=Arthrobotrys musiformis TaxID=47236 RepID=A0AAV9VSB1_9PEZI
MAPKFEAPCYPGLESQLRSPKFTDVTIIAGASRSRIPCHRLILAEHSTSLSFSCSDTQTTELSIPRWEPQILQHVLRYLYTGDLEALEFDTLMNLYECAEDLGINCLMQKTLYDAVLETGRCEIILRDRSKLFKLVEKIFSLTAEEERQSYVYKGVFRLMLSMVQQDELMKEDCFLGLIREYRELGVELLKAALEGQQGTGVIHCFKEGCEGIIGEWRTCISCSSSQWGGEDW